MSKLPKQQKHQNHTKKIKKTPTEETTTSEIEEYETKQTLETKEYHPLINSNSLEQYLNNYHLKFVDFDVDTKESLTLPLIWQCLYYHQMGADLEFDVLEDVMDEKEKTDILWKEWNDKTLKRIITEYDSDDNKDDDIEDALLTQVPDFIFDFYKDIDCMDIYNDSNNQKHQIFVYRIRRWISEDLQSEEAKEIPKKFKNLPKYSWKADTISYLDDYILSDDLIVIQNTNLLSTPTWFKWL